MTQRRGRHLALAILALFAALLVVASWYEDAFKAYLMGWWTT